MPPSDLHGPTTKPLRVAPQVGQGSPVKRRNQQRGHGKPEASQMEELVTATDDTARKRNSKSVSFGANGLRYAPSLCLSICIADRGENGGKNCRI